MRSCRWGENSVEEDELENFHNLLARLTQRPCLIRRAAALCAALWRHVTVSITAKLKVTNFYPSHLLVLCWANGA